ncbi:unnamed protein product [Phaeothamnion confervicola]
MGDLNEYNQCQTQLRELYDLGLGRDSEPEFCAYRILYYVYLSSTRQRHAASSMLIAMLREMQAGRAAGGGGGGGRRGIEHPAVRHALAVRAAVTAVDFRAFFALYRESPNMGAYLIDPLCDRMRALAVQRILKACRPTVPTEFVLTELMFDEEAATAAAGSAAAAAAKIGPDNKGVQVLERSGIVFSDDRELIETAKSRFDASTFSTSEGERRTLL